MLADLLRAAGQVVLRDHGAEVVVRSSPQTLTGHAGRLRLLVAERAQRVPHILAVYNPETGLAEIHVTVHPLEAP